MSTPVPVVHLALGAPPLTVNTAPSLWIDVSDYVAVADADENPYVHSIRRGRNHERDEIEAGTAIVILKNTDRRFDPSNTTAPAPYANNIKPMTKIRIGASWGTPTPTIYWQFYGYVESWTPDYPGGSVSTCTLECVDAFKMFGMIDIHSPGNRAQEYSNNRITAALDAILWPAAERGIATGDLIVAEMQLDAPALGIIQQTARTERGTFYISRDGNAIFEAGSFRDTSVSVGTWGDAAGGSELPYSDLTLRYDDSTIMNQVYATRPGGIEQHALNTTSQGDYFVRTYISESLPWKDDTDAWDAARRLVARYGNPMVRPERLTIDPGVRDTWTDVLPRDISDRITITRRTLNGGTPYSADAFIEAVEWRITKGLWECTWLLSPVFVPGPVTGTLSTTSDWKDVATGIGFLNGWHNLGGVNGPVEYRKEGEWVYLRGLAAGGTVGTSGSTMFTLPVGYRPPYNTFQPVMSSGTLGEVGIQTDGDVPAISGSSVYFDLSAIRFRVI